MKIPDTPRIKLNYRDILRKMAKENIRVELNDPKKFKKQLKLNYKWVLRNSTPLKILMRSKEAMNEIHYFKSGTGLGFSKIASVKYINPQLAYLLGSFRDGSLILSSGKHWVRVYDAMENSWLEESLLSIFQSLFRVKPHLRINERNNTKYIDISSKPLCMFLKIILGEKIHKDVPDVIKEASKIIQKYYIRGFFDAEGFVHKKENEIRISQLDRNSLKFIKNFLSKQRIPSSVSGHQLLIFGRSNVEKFYKIIGSSNPSKLKRFYSLGISA